MTAEERATSGVRTIQVYLTVSRTRCSARAVHRRCGIAKARVVTIPGLQRIASRCAAPRRRGDGGSPGKQFVGCAKACPREGAGEACAPSVLRQRAQGAQSLKPLRAQRPIQSRRKPRWSSHAITEAAEKEAL